MKNICFYFQIHQPFRLRQYRFFDIGNNHYYYDDYLNESIARKIADKCYLPANKRLLEQIKKNPSIKVSFSISGIALDQFELYTPEVITSFKKLARTGNVEFLTETYAHSLVSLKNEMEFKRQVQKHKQKIEELFDVIPTTFRNTELIYSDEIGRIVYDMGFKGMITEGAKHILGWKSPNYLYYNSIQPRLKLLLRNFKLSDDIAFRFSNKGWDEYPLTSTKFLDWLKDIDKKEETINLFMDYETFGEHQWEEEGIFDFLEGSLQAIAKEKTLGYILPGEALENFQPIAPANVPYPISWADEERDLTAWLGNELQEDAYNKLYSIVDKVQRIKDFKILKDWDYLQSSDHFYYMCTKFFSDGEVHAYFNPYDSPYDAYINYMNVLSDFILRVNAAAPETDKDMEIASLTKIINEKDRQISKISEELLKIKTSSKPTKKTTTSKKPTATKESTAKTKKKATAKSKEVSTRSKSTKSKSEA